MSNTNTGGPALPTATLAQKTDGGMTLRDYFAAKAMQCYWNDPEVVGTQAQAAEWAYEMADEMLARRAT
jgi:hypothetical protein